MRELTTLEVERCFLASGGFKPHTPGVILSEYELPGGYNTFLLPHDHNFWFPRLWDRLESLTPFYTFALEQGKYTLRVGALRAWSIDRCLVLCNAIESLTMPKGKRSKKS